MKENPTFSSQIAHYIYDFLDEKRAMGFKYTSEARTLKKFDSYWIENGYGNTPLSADNLDGWLQKKAGEGASVLKEKTTVVRQFSLYLNSLSIPSYVPAMPPCSERPVRPILKREHIGALFDVIDNRTVKNNSKDLIRINNEYPILFRLIYLNGLRVSEACTLQINQLDIISGKVEILNGKGKKDRVIYLAEDFLQICKDYIEYLSSATSDCRWLFPGLDTRKHICVTWISHLFRSFWDITPYANYYSVSPTVHDLRHAFVVNRINQWLEQGLSFDQMLPFLSCFLGHKSFSETYYYYHYAEEAVRTIRKMDKTIEKIIPEVLRR